MQEQEEARQKAEQDEAQRRSERSEFLCEVAQGLFDAAVFDEERIVFRRGRIALVVDAYFILSEAFKRWRIVDDHLTEFPKIAALQCMAIMAFQPFRALNLADAQTTAEAKCNELFAINCAAAVLGFTIGIDRPGETDFWLRLIDILSELDSETVEAFRVERSQGAAEPGQKFYREIHPNDKLPLNNLICIFELLVGKISLLLPRGHFIPQRDAASTR